MKRFFRNSANYIALAAGVIMLLIVNAFLKDWIIIRYGVRNFGNIQKIGISLTIFGAIVAVARFAAQLRNVAHHERERRVRSEQEQQAQVLNHHSESGPDPELIRRKFQQLILEAPGFAELIRRCIEQMDRMDVLQMRQSRLISSNDATYLKETETVLDNVERRLCRNFQNIINLCIAAGSPEKLLAEKVETYLVENEERLQDSQQLLNVSVDWINQYNIDRSSDRRELESWIATITASLKED